MSAVSGIGRDRLPRLPSALILLSALLTFAIPSAGLHDEALDAHVMGRPGCTSPQIFHKAIRDMKPIYNGLYNNVTLPRLAGFKRRLLSEILGNAPCGFGGAPARIGHMQYDLYPQVASCPPERPMKKYGGRFSLEQSGPITYHNTDLEARRVSTEEDGRKFFCDLDVLESPCIIYSMGSNGDFKFEASMLNSTACDVFTFDCTYNGTAIHPSRHFYYPWCFGTVTSTFNKPGGGPKIVKTWDETTTALGHKKVDVLKIDIEGGEFAVLHGLELGSESLPMQIAVEIHMEDPMKRFEPRSSIHTSVLFLHLANLGYAPFSRDDNFFGSCCSEFTFIRVVN